MIKDYIQAQVAIRDMAALFNRLQQDYVVVDTNMRCRGESTNVNLAHYLCRENVSLSEKLDTMNSCLLMAGF